MNLSIWLYESFISFVERIIWCSTIPTKLKLQFFFADRSVCKKNRTSKCFRNILLAVPLFLINKSVKETKRKYFFTLLGPSNWK